MPAPRRASLLASLLTSQLLVACGDDGGGSTQDTATTTAADTTAAAGTSTGVPTTGSDDAGVESVRPNWHEDVAPLVAAHCQSCHSAGGIAPFSLGTYAESKDWALLMAQSVAGGQMPPWHALETDECAPPYAYKHDARLSDDEKALFQAWADQDAPEGDPARAAPLPEPPSLDLAGPSTTVLADAEVAIAKSGPKSDFFHCLSIDPANTDTVYLDGLQVIPGNRKIVHHVLIFVDAQGASAGWAGGIKQDCGGGSGINGGQLIGAWVPGAMPIETPTDVGVELTPGTRLILNVHYHAAATEETDVGTGVALRWETSPPAWQSIFALIGAPGVGSSLQGPLMIPAGAAGHVEEYEYTIGAGGQSFPDLLDVRVWTVMNHMHKVGVDMRVWVEDRDTGDATCLLHTPRWDYNWQRSYAFDAPITGTFRVRSGDKVRVRCVYDNTLANPGVQEILAESGLKEPIDIGLGEGTLDEMCLTGVGVAIKGGL